MQLFFFGKKGRFDLEGLLGSRVQSAPFVYYVPVFSGSFTNLYINRCINQWKK